MKDVIVEDIGLLAGKKVLLDHISMRLSAGHIYGLIGRNGSGKTMLMKCVCGYLEPTYGKILIDGNKVSKYNKQIGIIIEHPGFIEQYSGYHNLMLLSSAGNKVAKEKIKDAMLSVGLDPKDPKKVKKYSLGMKQKLGFVQAFMEEQKFLVLDEPTNGVDIEGLQIIRDKILKLKKEGKIILLASHNREDIGILCDEIYEMEAGRVIAT